MTDNEYRALIEHYAAKLISVSKEAREGYGLPKKDTIMTAVKRLRELADNLEG